MSTSIKISLDQRKYVNAVNGLTIVVVGHSKETPRLDLDIPKHSYRMYTIGHTSIVPWCNDLYTNMSQYSKRILINISTV